MRIEVPVESFTIRSKDGAGVRVHKTGTGPHRWLLTPGLGTPLLCWKHIFEAFHQRMTIVTWDQRGLFDSERLRDRSALRFERHVDDAEAIVERLGWNSFVTGSWSMGVQLGLGLYERMPERIQALALINGAFEHVLSTAYGPALTAPLLRATLAGLVRGARVLNPAARRLLASGTAGLLMDKLAVSTANAPAWSDSARKPQTANRKLCLAGTICNRGQRRTATRYCFSMAAIASIGANVKRLNLPVSN